MTTTQNTPARKWQMTKLGKSDWLLPANDRSTVFRISTYTDIDVTPDDREVERTYWGAWRWPRPVAALTGDHSYDPLEDWDAWVQIAHYCATRKEAIDAALRWEWEQSHPVHDQPRRKPVSIAEMFGRK